MKLSWLLGFGAAVLLVGFPGTASAQKEKKNDEEFVKEKPAIGDALPDLTVYNPDGKEVKLSSLRGHVVLTFGCLT